MIGKMRKSLASLVAAGLLALSSVKGDEPKKSAVVPAVNLTLTEVVADNQCDLTRVEVNVKDLPYNSDFYVVGEHTDAADTYKLRLQVVPLRLGVLEAGVVGQHVGSSVSESDDQAGVVLRLKGNPAEGLFVKADTRYFPETKDLDGYVILNAKKVFADVLWKYNTETGIAMIRPGIDYKMHKNIWLGVEAKYAGEIKDLENTYLGLRAKLVF